MKVYHMSIHHDKISILSRIRATNKPFDRPQFWLLFNASFALLPYDPQYCRSHISSVSAHQKNGCSVSPRHIASK